MPSSVLNAWLVKIIPACVKRRFNLAVVCVRACLCVRQVINMQVNRSPCGYCSSQCSKYNVQSCMHILWLRSETGVPIPKYLELLTLFLRLCALRQLNTLTFHSPKTLVRSHLYKHNYYRIAPSIQLTAVNTFSFCSIMDTLLHWNCCTMPKNVMPSLSAVASIWK